MSTQHLGFALLLGLVACSSGDPEASRQRGPAPARSADARPTPPPAPAREAADEDPYFVTQALVDEERGELVTEEALRPPGAPRDERIALEAARPGFEAGTFLGQQTYRLRRRDPGTGALRAEIAGDGRPRPPILQAADGWLLIPTLDRRALLVEAEGREIARLEPPDPGHEIARARRIPGTSRVLVLTRPAGAPREPEARLVVWDVASRVMVRSLRFRYVPRVYRATSPLADMNQRAAYDGCVRQGAQGFCQDRLRSWKYRLVLPRDRGLDVAVSADASTAVVYAFGDLHVYDLRAGELSLVRTVRDVFYADADHFTLWPKVVISRTGRWAALRGTWRLVRVVELASGTTRAWFDHQGIADPWPLAQRRSWAPTAWGAITAPEDGLMLLDRAGQVQSIALSGLNDPRPLRSHGQGDPLSASRLLRYQDTLVLWSNSSLRLVRLGSGALIRKLGWEVLPEGFDAPRVAQYVKDRTRWFESPSSPTF